MSDRRLEIDGISKRYGETIALREMTFGFVGSNLIWLSGRIYRNAVLRTGAKVKLREALPAA